MDFTKADEADGDGDPMKGLPARSTGSVYKYHDRCICYCVFVLCLSSGRNIVGVFIYVF